jgi:hypothetical protein
MRALRIRLSPRGPLSGRRRDRATGLSWCKSSRSAICCREYQPSAISDARADRRARDKIAFHREILDARSVRHPDDDDGILERSDRAAGRAAAERSDRSRPGIRDRARQSRRVPARSARRLERRRRGLAAGMPGEGIFRSDRVRVDRHPVKYLVDANVLSEPTKPVPDARVVEWLRHNQADLAVATSTCARRCFIKASPGAVNSSDDWPLARRFALCRSNRRQVATLKPSCADSNREPAPPSRRAHPDRPEPPARIAAAA